MATSPLKLAAEDSDDLKALSALVQDAILTVADMAYLPKARRFALVLNRFRWEAGSAQGRGERVRAGLRFEGVTAAKATRLRQDTKDVVLSLLAVTFEPAAEPESASGTVELTFAGGAAIRLGVEALEAHLDDLTEAWPAQSRPSHEPAD